MKNYKANNKYHFITFLLVVSVLCYSCDEFVVIDQPNSQLTTSAVFNDPTTATATLTDIYAQMREQGLTTGRINGLSCLLGTYADELISFENGIYTAAPFYSNSLSSTMTYIGNIWSRSYSQIYAANAVIEGVSNSPSLTQSVKYQLSGEALFIRAFLHFNLLNLYGDVPYIKTTDYNLNTKATRMTTELVYENIITDLENAIQLLNITYIQPGRNRPNRAAAQALLARVYLYNSDYPQAAFMASAVLNETSLYGVVNNLDQVFLKNSSSTIWQLSAGSNGGNTYEGSIFIFLAGPPNRVSLTEELIHQFEPNDLRKVHWVKSVTKGSNIWYHPFKYKQNSTTSTTLENSIVFRLEEQYLIRAEARVMQGDLIGARQDLNVIRNRAGLTGTLAISQGEIIDALQKERRTELFTEFGHRFFDLKRWNQLDQVLSGKPGWNSTDSLWPLPLAEMNANPYLKPQNNGY